jgi:dTDP-4-dehydrorhamnose 3,5-epimerase-like enzyme
MLALVSGYNPSAPDHDRRAIGPDHPTIDPDASSWVVPHGLSQKGSTRMDQRIIIEPIAFPTDARGLVLEPIGPDALPLQRNVHLVLTGPGCVRGNHAHQRGTEITVVLGPALARYRDGDAVRDVHVPEGRAYRFTIPPGVPHAFRNTGTGLMVLIGFNTVAHDPGRPDVVRDVLIEA